MNKEKFALYGFEVEIPSDWRVEVNPKSARSKGDVVFQTEKGNRFFVSWGPLEDATKRFKTLEELRENSFDQVRKGSDVKYVNVSDLNEIEICGHRALTARLRAEVRGGMMSRRSAVRNILSAHFHCPDLSRYYVVYSMERDTDEYEDMTKVFDSFAKSIVCHRTNNSPAASPAEGV